MRIVWTPRAVLHLHGIETYIERDNPAAAHRVRKDIVRQVEALQEAPFLGRTGRVARTRELVIARTPYIVAYHVAGNEIRILAILHAAREWPESLGG